MHVLWWEVQKANEHLHRECKRGGSKQGIKHNHKTHFGVGVKSMSQVPEPSPLSRSHLTGEAGVELRLVINHVEHTFTVPKLDVQIRKPNWHTLPQALDARGWSKRYR